MKKFFIAAVLLCAGMLSAEEIKIDGTFKNISSKTNLPSYWVKNGPGVKDASLSVIKDAKGNILKIKSKGKYVAFYSASRIPVVPGAVYKVTTMIKGTAAKNFSIGYYSYSATNKFLASSGAGFVVNSPDKFTRYEGTFTISKNPATKFMRVQFGSSSAMDIEIQSICVEAVPAAK